MKMSTKAYIKVPFDNVGLEYGCSFMFSVIYIVYCLRRNKVGGLGGKGYWRGLRRNGVLGVFKKEGYTGGCLRKKGAMGVV